MINTIAVEFLEYTKLYILIFQVFGTKRWKILHNNYCTFQCWIQACKLGDKLVMQRKQVNEINFNIYFVCSQVLQFLLIYWNKVLSYYPNLIPPSGLYSYFQEVSSFIRSMKRLVLSWKPEMCSRNFIVCVWQYFWNFSCKYMLI